MLSPSNKALLVKYIFAVGGVALAIAPPPAAAQLAVAQSAGTQITVSTVVPTELNAPYVPGANGSGGAPDATPEQAAAFAWQEFIALNWPAGPQEGKPGQRGVASTTYRFGDPNYSGPTVWETFRGKVEIFPGQDNPPGYPAVAPGESSYGFDAPPQYKYLPTKASVSACDSTQANTQTPWINLDEIDQITLDFMYAGIVDSASSPDNLAPQLIRFMAKANRDEYVYVAKNGWWSHIPQSIVDKTRDFLRANMYSPPSGSSQYVSLPDGTIEIKAAWRPLNPSEIASGRFHSQHVRFYELTGTTPSGVDAYCYRDATWGLVALHIIQKTPSAPYFIYASFEQADNILTADGKSVEDTDGLVIAPGPATATTPQVCLSDPKPQSSTPPPPPDKSSTQGKVILTTDPQKCTATQTSEYCDTPGRRLYYKNEFGAAPLGGNICINRRINDLPQYVTNANKIAHIALNDYLNQNQISSAPWLYYKLINVQYYPFDKIITTETATPNGSLYDAQPPYTAKNPARSNFYMANIVVETNRALQLFSGGLSPSISTDWNQDGTPHKNTYYGGKFYNAGGCLGCHGSQGQIPGLPNDPKKLAGDFSVILARGAVEHPEGVEKPGLTFLRTLRNRRILE